MLGAPMFDPRDPTIKGSTKLMQNFQERIAEVIDEYLLLGARDDDIKTVLQQEIESDLVQRARELGV
jgi:hypothetical protein